MDWKQVAVNTITALLVAVLSGVLVWVFTRTPDNKEGLTYSISQAGGFGLGKDRLTFYAVNINNRGSVKAENVNISIKQKSDAALFQNQSQFARPVPENIKYKKFGSNISIVIPSFLPSDRARFSLVYRGIPKTPEVLIRSNDGIGRVYNEKDQDESIFVHPWKLFLTFLAFAGYVIFVSVTSKKIFSRYNFFFRSDKNNSGFLLLHAGLFDLASTVFQQAINNGQTGPLVLSNFAAVKSFQGSDEEARKLLTMAVYWASSKRANGVVLFNNFLYLYNKKDFVGSLKVLESAIKADRVIITYCKKSLIVLDIMSKDDNVKNLIESYDKPKKSSNQ